jgi:hypothetical protein
MRVDRIRSQSGMASAVTIAALASLVLGSSVVRGSADDGRVNAQNVVRPSASGGVVQQPAGNADHSVANGEDDDDSDGGGPPFGIACPILIGATWSTKLLGTAAWDFAFDVATDDEICAIFVAGYTAGPLAGSSGLYDGFVARYSTIGALEWVRQLGSPANDSVSSIATDSQHSGRFRG